MGTASSGDESASDRNNGTVSTMRRRRCLRRRLHHHTLRTTQSGDKSTDSCSSSSWPFWWLSAAAAVVVCVTPNLPLPFIASPAGILYEQSMERLVGSGFDGPYGGKMFCPNYEDEHFFDAFKKPRPQGVRYRDDATLHRIAMQYHTAYPVMVQERRRPEMVEQGGGGESSSSVRNDPTLEDIDLIDVLWREDIEREKSGSPAVAAGLHPSDQVERDLQLLTEKSVQTPLTREESNRYEDLSKVYFEDFYSNRRFAGEFTTEKANRRVVGGGSTSSSTASGSCSPCSSSSASSSSTVLSSSSSFAPPPSGSGSSSGFYGGHPTVAAAPSAASQQQQLLQDEKYKRHVPTPSDAEVDALFEDLGRECGELNRLMPTGGGAALNCGPNMGQVVQHQQHAAAATGYTGPIPTPDTLVQNASLSALGSYNQANLTEVDYMLRDGPVVPVSNAEQHGSLSNETHGYPPPTHFWFESAPEGAASYQSRHPVLNLTSLQLQPAASLPNVTADPTIVSELRQLQGDDMSRPPAHHELTTLTGRMPVYEPLRHGSALPPIGSGDSSLAASSSSSSSSPRYSTTSTAAGSDGENRSPRSRFYGKLAPSVRPSVTSPWMDDDEEEEDKAAPFFRMPTTSSTLNSGVTPRRRGRQSKDEQLAASNGLPVSAHEIAEMSLPDLQRLLKTESLTEPQRQLIRKIRRRGKNKVAARTCRQRRGMAREYALHENSRVLGFNNRR